MEDDDASPEHRRRPPLVGEPPPPGHRRRKTSGTGSGRGLFGLGLFARPRREVTAPPVDEDAPTAAPTERSPTPEAEPIPAKPQQLRPARATSRRRIRSHRPFRGHYSRPTARRGQRRDLAWDAILRAAAPWQGARSGALAISVRPDELLAKLRTHRPGRLLLLVVDISGSMGTAQMSLAKRTALALLDRAYLERDRVAMIAFRQRHAELLLPPTDHPDQVRRAVVDLACGGTTPLAAGLELAQRTLEAATRGRDGDRAALLLISDGRANVGARPGLAALEAELDAAAAALARRSGLRRLFVDTTPPGKHDRAAQWLAERLRAERFLLWKLQEQGRDPTRELLRALR